MAEIPRIPATAPSQPVHPATQRVGESGERPGGRQHSQEEVHDHLELREEEIEVGPTSVQHTIDPDASLDIVA